MLALARTLRLESIASLLSLAALAACASGASSDNGASDTSEGAASVRDGDLWAGSTSITIERNAQDPCSNGAHELDTQPVEYDEYARERATDRNICFEVYKPGVTDQENPDFWRLLDVRVQYRFAGQSEWKEAYVDALDRRGNNRRYKWALLLDYDPLYMTMDVGDMQAPFDITREWPGGFSISSKLEVTFTVNGHKLSNSKNAPFVIDYVGSLRVPELETKPNGHVLHQELACDGLKLGTGAGYYAADVTDPSAIAKLTPALDGSLIRGARMASNTAQGTTPTIVSLGFGAKNDVQGQTLPRYYDETYNRPAKGEVRPQGSKMIVSVPVYDRAAKAKKKIEVTFDNCH